MVSALPAFIWVLRTFADKSAGYGANIPGDLRLENTASGDDSDAGRCKVNPQIIGSTSPAPGELASAAAILFTHDAVEAWYTPPL